MPSAQASSATTTAGFARNFRYRRGIAEPQRGHLAERQVPVGTATVLCVPKTWYTSCDQAVFVDVCHERGEELHVGRVP